MMMMMMTRLMLLECESNNWGGATGWSGGGGVRLLYLIKNESSYKSRKCCSVVERVKHSGQILTI